MQKIILQGIKDRDRYDRILQRLKNKTQSPPIEKEPPPMKRSRVWKKFFVKTFNTIVLPFIAILALLALVIGFTGALIYFGVAIATAKVLGPLISMGIPFLVVTLRRLYKDSVAEVATENKKLMKDLKGNY
jgi:hypothetical protein